MTPMDTDNATYACSPLLSSSQSIWDVPPLTHDPVTGEFAVGGCVFRQLFNDVPALKPLYAREEMYFNALPYVYFADRYFWVAFALSAAYLVLCFAGQRIMASRKPFGLENTLAGWNLLLAVFSTIGFWRTAPHLLYYLKTEGFYDSICARAEPSYGHGAAGLWTMLFIFSKIPELVDTVFIVLRKKPLILLHWYHHFTVLLYCWHSYATRSSAGLYFVAMNYGVHSIMYFYYFLAAVKYRAPWAGLVTFLQISQMFVGVAICIAVFYYETVQGLPCSITRENYFAGLIMYGSYFVLFMLFALERYIWPNKRSAITGSGPKPTSNGASKPKNA